MNDSRPPVRLVRRTSDFQRRPATHLLQMGTTCCTCCLIWVGTAVGGSLGWVHGWRTLGENTNAIHWRRIRAVYVLLGSALMTFFIAAALGGLHSVERFFPQALLGGLALFSPLNFLLLGAAGLLTAYWSTRRSEPAERDAVRRGACRLLWMSFNYANVGWIVSLGAMRVWGEQTFSPLVCFVAALSITVLIPLCGLLGRRTSVAETPSK